jgi:putative NIF3 family GTP cyclohydrolase 1 type 2
LITNALAASADFFITSDLKYHEFFEAYGKIVIADIGHFESEQFAPQVFGEILQKKFPNFAVLKSEHITNPVQYYL